MGSRKASLLAANEREDKEIAKLEKLLNLRRRKKKKQKRLPASFWKEGLGCIHTLVPRLKSLYLVSPVFHCKQLPNNGRVSHSLFCVTFKTRSIWAFICCMIQVLWCFPEPLLPDLLDLTDKDSSEWNLSGDEVEGMQETLTCGESLVWLLNSLKWCAYFDWLLFLCVPGSLSESGEEPEEAETRVMRSHRTSRGRTKDSSWPESIPKEREKLKLEWKEIGEEEEKDKGKKSESDLCLKGQEVATKKGILKESLSRARGEKKRKSGAKRVRFNLKRTDEPSSDSDDMDTYNQKRTLL